MGLPDGQVLDRAGCSVFEVRFLEWCTTRCVPLSGCSEVLFEDVDPVRGFGWARGQRHFPGWWWSATTRRLVPFESWLERDQAMVLDFDPDVIGFSAQPFWLSWSDGDRVRRHAPDFFARTRDGGACPSSVGPADQHPTELLARLDPSPDEPERTTAIVQSITAVIRAGQPPDERGLRTGHGSFPAKEYAA